MAKLFGLAVILLYLWRKGVTVAAIGWLWSGAIPSLEIGAVPSLAAG